MIIKKCDICGCELKEHTDVFNERKFNVYKCGKLVVYNDLRHSENYVCVKCTITALKKIIADMVARR